MGSKQLPSPMFIIAPLPYHKLLVRQIKKKPVLQVTYRHLLLNPIFHLNGLIVLRNILTGVIDNEQKGKAIKTIIKLKNKK